MSTLGVVGPGSLLEALGKAGRVSGACLRYVEGVETARDDAARLKQELDAVRATLEHAVRLAGSSDSGSEVDVTQASGPADAAAGPRFPALRELLGGLGHGDGGGMPAPVARVLDVLDKKLGGAGGSSSSDDSAPGPSKAPRRYGLRALVWPLRKNEVDECVATLERFKATLSNALETDTASMTLAVRTKVENIEGSLSATETARLLDRLAVAEGAAHDSRLQETQPHCLDGTRVGLRRRIEEWAGDASQAPIFWLSGAAGTGKSTISRTVADLFSEQRRLGGTFFFSRGGGNLANAGMLFTSLARQLAKLSLTLRALICDAVRKDEDVSQKGLARQWGQLLVTPLTHWKARGERTPIVVIIDALDECDSQDDVQRILELIAGAGVLEVLGLRIFMTSRPETPIQIGFRHTVGNLHQELILHDVPREIVDEDIRIYLRHELEKTRRRAKSLPPDWPGAEVIDDLVSRAHGLFIYAATLCRFITKSSRIWPVDGLLRRILADGEAANADGKKIWVTRESPTKDLDAIYTQILEHSLQDVDESDFEYLSELFRHVAGAVVLLFENLPLSNLAKLLMEDEAMVRIRLEPLQALLSLPEDESLPIRILHPSFRDFLLDSKRCLNSLFALDEVSTNRRLAYNCLDIMGQLRQDICNQIEPGIEREAVSREVIEHSLSPELRYACEHWVSHLARADGEIGDGGLVDRFLRTHLLHWMEALAWMDRLSVVRSAIRSLKALATSNPVRPSELSLLLLDIEQFFGYNWRAIQEHPLQLYVSALVFVPKQSLLCRQFGSAAPGWFRRLPNVEDYWNDTGLDTVPLPLESGFPHETVRFSPDGRLLVACTPSAEFSPPIVTVSTYSVDSFERQCIFKQDGHPYKACDLVISPDSKLIALWSRLGDLHVWDVFRGVRIQRLHRRLVLVAAFSTCNTSLVCAKLTYGDCSGKKSVAVEIIRLATGSASSDWTSDLPSDEAIEDVKVCGGTLVAIVSSRDRVESLTVVGKRESRSLQTVSHGERRLGLRGRIDATINGGVVASVLDDRCIHIWSVESDKEPVKIPADRRERFKSCHVLATGIVVALAYYIEARSSIILIGEHPGSVRRVRLRYAMPMIADFSPHGPRVALYGRGGISVKLLATLIAEEDANYKPGSISSTNRDRCMPEKVKTEYGMPEAFLVDDEPLAMVIHGSDIVVATWRCVTRVSNEAGQVISRTRFDMLHPARPVGAQAMLAPDTKFVLYLNKLSEMRIGTSEFHHIVFNVGTGLPLLSRLADRELGERVGGEAFSPDSQRLMAVVWRWGSPGSGHLAVVDLVTDSVRVVHLTGMAADSTVLFSPDGSRLCLALRDPISGEENVTFYDTAAWAPVRLVPVDPGVQAMIWSEDLYSTPKVQYLLGKGRLPEPLVRRGAVSRPLPIISYDNVKRWVLRKGKRVLLLPVEYKPRSWAVSGGLLALAMPNGKIVVMEFSDEE